MMMSQSSGRRGIAWAIVGGLVLIAGIVAIIVSAILAQPAPTPSDTPTTSSTPEPTASELPDGAFVDPTAADRGWTPEPITTDADIYIRAALAAASTFDTTKSTREEWLDYLDTWFTPDTRFTSKADQLAAMTDSQTELRQGVVLPQEEWDSLTGEDGRVAAVVGGAKAHVPRTHRRPLGRHVDRHGRCDADLHSLGRFRRRNVLRRARARERAGAVRGSIRADSRHRPAGRRLQGRPLFHGAVGALTWEPR